jgi:hypothetical protein
MKGANPFDKENKLDANIHSAIKWMASRTPVQVSDDRESITKSIETLRQESIDCGDVDKRFVDTDSVVRNISRTVNGPVLESLASESDHCDSNNIQMFRDGCDLLGLLPCSGVGDQHDFPAHDSITELLGNRKQKNVELISDLTNDSRGDESLAVTLADYKAGRMTKPIEISKLDLENISIARRFGVEQGLRPDGTVKVRPVDDESASGINGCTQRTENCKTTLLIPL